MNPATLFWSEWYGAGGTQEAGLQYLKALDGDLNVALSLLVAQPAPQPEPTPAPRPLAAYPGIDRVDFVWTSQVFAINTFREVYGKWYAVGHEAHPAEAVSTLEDRLTALEQNGWTVRRWPGGARAWRNGLVPVRKAWAIKKLRDDLARTVRPELEGVAWSLDLAYDL